MSGCVALCSVQDGGNRQPRLLQRLEFLLQEKLSMADTMASTYNDPISAPQGISNMRYSSLERCAVIIIIHQHANRATVPACSTGLPVTLSTSILLSWAQR